MLLPYRFFKTTAQLFFKSINNQWYFLSLALVRLHSEPIYSSCLGTESKSEESWPGDFIGYTLLTEKTFSYFMRVYWNATLNGAYYRETKKQNLPYFNADVGLAFVHFHSHICLNLYLYLILNSCDITATEYD